MAHVCEALGAETVRGSLAARKQWVNSEHVQDEVCNTILWPPSVQGALAAVRHCETDSPEWAWCTSEVACAWPALTALQANS